MTTTNSKSHHRGDQRIYTGSIAAYCGQTVTITAAPCCHHCERKDPARIRLQAADGQTLKHVRPSSLLPVGTELDATRYLTAALALGTDRIEMLRAVADPAITVIWTVHGMVIRDYPAGAVGWALEALNYQGLIDRCGDSVMRVTDLGKAFLVALDHAESGR
jgi:hypothetical protein